MSGTRAAAALAAALVFSIAAASAGQTAPAPVAVLPPLSLSSDPDRSFADVPLRQAPENAAAVSVAFASPVPVAAVRAVTFHLRSGSGWLSAQIPPERARGTVRLPLAAFSPDGSAGPARAADALRVSLWRRAPESDTAPLPVSSAAFSPPAAVAVAGSGPYAARCSRILERAGIDFDLLPATGFTKEILAGVRVLFLPEPDSSGREDSAQLRQFVRGGGRLVVFYSADPALSRAIGLLPGSWEGSETGWRAMSVAGTGRRIPHETRNRICPRPGPGARTLATWVAADGRDTAAPAVVLTPSGAWFSHVPPRAFPAACDLVRGIVDALAPGVAPARTAPPPAAPVATPPGFRLGAWIPAEHADSPAPKACDLLFVDAPAARFSAKTSGGPRVWMKCLLSEGGAWLDPSDPGVRRKIAADAVRFVRSGAAGVHLDYVRSPGGGAPDEKRAAAVTALVREISRAVREADARAEISAAVFPTPADAAAVDQDWPGWIAEGLVDYVCPMIYDDDAESFRARLGACLDAAPAAALVPGIGTGADESQTGAATAAAELSACVEAGCRGAAFFRLDDSLPELLGAVLRRP